MHHTRTHVMHIAFGLWQCITVWSTKEIHKQTPNNTEHVCQASVTMFKVLEFYTSINGPSLAPNQTANTI